MKYHLIAFWRTERSSFSVLKISWKFCKCWGNIIFLPASCVEKDLFLLAEMHNINFSFSLNMKFHFVHSCLCNNLSFFRRNLFLLNILKDPTNLHCKGKYEIRLRNFFSLTFKGLQHDTCQCCSHQRFLKAGSVTWVLQKPKERHQYFNWKSYQPWSNTVYKKNIGWPLLFLFLRVTQMNCLYCCIRITLITLIQNGGFCLLRLLPLMTEFSVFMSLQSKAPRNSWLGGCFFEVLLNYMEKKKGKWKQNNT